MSSTEIDIPSAIYTGSVADLYGFIAAEVVAFARDRGIATPPAGPDSAPRSSLGDGSSPGADTADTPAPSPAPAADSPSAAGDGSGDAQARALERGGSTEDPEAAAADGLGDWANVEADRGGGGAEAGDGTFFPPLGFCFSFPMVQSGLTACAPPAPAPARTYSRARCAVANLPSAAAETVPVSARCS